VQVAELYETSEKLVRFVKTSCRRIDSRQFVECRGGRALAPGTRLLYVYRISFLVRRFREKIRPLHKVKLLKDEL